jgi:hypothetical protein
MVRRWRLLGYFPILYNPPPPPPAPHLQSRSVMTCARAQPAYASRSTCWGILIRLRKLICVYGWARSAGAPEADIYIVDVGPFNVRGVYAWFRTIRMMVNPPMLIALVTITEQRQPDALADLFDYYIHKPVDRKQMDVFPDVVSQEASQMTRSYDDRKQELAHTLQKVHLADQPLSR